MDNKIEKSTRGVVSKDAAQYSLTLAVIAIMLYVVGIPFYVIFFLSAFSFFLFKIFRSDTRGETRDIFDFYMSASEMLRADGRLWYGFELREAVARGEKIIQAMSAAPPLLHFTLGALYQKIGDHNSAVHHLEAVFDDGGNKESSIAFPTPALREYVRVLRKIEREPGEAPRISSAVRSLERLRKTRGQAMFDESRGRFTESDESSPRPIMEAQTGKFVFFQDDGAAEAADAGAQRQDSAVRSRGHKRARHSGHEPNGQASGHRSDETNYGSERKTISEVLQDIYDDKVQ